MMKKLKYIIPSIYLVVGICVWLQFMSSPPDGLANIGIVMYVLPITIIGFLIFGKTFPFFSGSYYVSHSKFFFMSILIITALIYLFCTLISMFTSRKTNKGKKNST
jgi:hypothetical protein